jgi:hypothetical protein
MFEIFNFFDTRKESVDQDVFKQYFEEDLEFRGLVENMQSKMRVGTDDDDEGLHFFESDEEYTAALDTVRYWLDNKGIRATDKAITFAVATLLEEEGMEEGLAELV